ncbi:MAG: DUF4347 domain-containing protein [Pegethrix bostrychoides GSE-TBD4-15B]|jgi:hypothetical protein|uniref:DUF4347 domain-containing protein n=1 Tax=Pegethrix bostrychoides GSE-TBD4-15B TaxID=2839662 RepID=A0A951U6M2_9CYAN|nr:DUF4347 domain-containing protein [Pegethrix bostrychoides GSE-TBD4-15B]
MPRSSQPTALLIIDAARPTWTAAVPCLPKGHAPKLERLELAAEQDGILQVTAALSNRTGLKSLHIAASGQAGSLQLGTAQLTLFNLDRYGWELQQWGESLMTGAQIVLHEGTAGSTSQFSSAFLSRLQLLTGAKITVAKLEPQQSVGF